MSSVSGSQDGRGDPRVRVAAEPLHVAEPHRYRPDIDGLRALAVLPILFNHAGVRGFGGGYVGVDIFFVISGYLITGILLRDIAAKRHSIAEFYRRRVLRIFPALFVMLAATTVLAMLALLPGELVRFARSLGGTALFSSNFVFLAEAGYFDSASRLKPLLHTWSLAVEEQFYILWPLLLAAIGVARRRALAVVMAAIAAASLALSLLLVAPHPSADFYLLPTRAWELALGGLLALHGRAIARGVAAEVLAALGGLAILFACWRFSAMTPFPGAAALVPCLGTAALIATGPHTLAGRVLSWRPIVFVGLVSYSLYLWHWPVIVFAEVWLLLPPAAPAVIAGEIIASGALAVLSWRYVETPFRVGGRRWPTPRVLAGGAIGIVAAVATAAALVLSGGLPARFSPAERAIAAYGDGDFEASFRRGSCFTIDPGAVNDPRCLAPARDGRPAVLLVGDSMAAHLWPGLAGYRDRYDILQATMAGCTPGVYTRAAKKCERFFRTTLTEWVAAQRPAAVILAGRWQDFDLPMLETTLATLQAARVPVVLVGPPPTYETTLPRLLTLAAHRRDPAILTHALSPISSAVDAPLAAAAARHGARYVSLVEAWCHDRACRTFAAPGVPLQFDYGHLTPAGSRVAAAQVVPALAAAVATTSPR